MHQIQLSDEVYESLRRAAALRGLDTVEEYIAHVAQQDVDPESCLFTPKRLAELDRISASIDAGAKTYTLDEVRASLEQFKADWRKKNAS
jgi:hypothetical protein